MKNLKSTLAFLFILVGFLSFAQEHPYFVIEENGGDFGMFLKVENTSNLATITVTGYSSTDGKQTPLNFAVQASELWNFSSKVAKINDLNKNNDFAIYQLTTVDKQGNVIKYPEVEVFFPENLADGFDAVASK